MPDAILIFGGSGSPRLTRKICEYLDVQPGAGEAFPRLRISSRRAFGVAGPEGAMNVMGFSRSQRRRGAPRLLKPGAGHDRVAAASFDAISKGGPMLRSHMLIAVLA